jgi:hypothetical protein
MIRLPLRALIIGLFSIVAWSPELLAAQGRVPFLIDQLKHATDFRLRTQAALALGASDDPAAVSPLCEGLDDASDSVRSASAAALGRLMNPSGVNCLRSHRGDSSASVRSVIERSIQLLEANGKPGKPPPPGPNDSIYVAIGTVTDKTGRSDDSVPQLVAAALQNKLLSTRGYAVAPQGETGAVAKKVIRQNSLRGYMLQARVEPPRSNGSSLTILVRVTMWSYPDKALQGEFTPKLTMPGASIGDRESEDNLIKMAVERAVDSFAQVVASSN